MARYSEVKIFRLKTDAPRSDLFISTHERIAVDLFGTGGFADTKMPSNAKRSTHLHSYIVSSHSEL
jgi:hypothetical protein